VHVQSRLAVLDQENGHCLHRCSEAREGCTEYCLIAAPLRLFAQIGALRAACRVEVFCAPKGRRRGGEPS
jgi:hypothetical protein